MRNKHLLAGLAGIGICVLILSCKTTPPAEESPVSATETSPVVQNPDGPPDQAALNNLAAAQAQAEAARIRAFDFDSPVYFSEETNAADAQYILAQTQPVTTMSEVQEAITLYTRVAGSFDRIFERTIPLYMEVLWKEIAAAREVALQSGSPEVFPVRLDKADAIKNEAVRFYEREKDYYPAGASGLLALDMYRILAVAAQVWHTRSEIEQQNFEQYDYQAFLLAEQVYQEALAAYDAQSLTEAQSKAEEALLRYNLVLDNALRNYVWELRETATEEREGALNLKANVAVQDRFTAAQNLFAEAEGLFLIEQYETAAELYFQAEYLFAGTALIAAEKRRIAQDAIQAAETQISNSETIARDAEIILGGDN